MAAFSTMAALAVGAAGVGSAVMGARGADKAKDAQVKAGKQANALQERQFQTQLGLYMPSYRLGQSALGLYASALGMPGYALMQQGYPGYSDPAGTSPNSPNPTLANPGGQPRPSGGALGRYIAQQQQELAAERAQAQPQQAPGAPPVPGQTLQQQNDIALQGVLGGTDIPSLVMNQPGYQSQLQQGLDAVQGSAAAQGSLRSGRTLKGLADYGQHTFGSYWDKWLSGIGNLAGIGQQAAGAVGQAGQNNANQQGANFQNIGNAQAQGAMGAANAWSQGLGSAAGAFSAFGAPQGIQSQPYSPLSYTPSPTASPYPQISGGFSYPWG